MYTSMWRPYELHLLVWLLLVTVQFSSTAFYFICFWCTCSLRDLWFPHQSCWRFRFSALLHHAIRQI